VLASLRIELMARAFSDDLRRRILVAYAGGGASLAALAERFAVSFEYVRKIRKQQLRTGQMERVPQARHGPVSRVTPVLQQQLRGQLREQPDLTLWELQQRVRDRSGVKLSKSLLWLWLQRLGLRVKKNRSTRKSKTQRKPGNGARRGGRR
jgi:transposase